MAWKAAPGYTKVAASQPEHNINPTLNDSIVYKRLERVAGKQGDIDMNFFVINSPEIGNEGAHIKYGNKVPC